MEEEADSLTHLEEEERLGEPESETRGGGGVEAEESRVHEVEERLGGKRYE